jgi:hypothetical protein
LDFVESLLKPGGYLPRVAGVGLVCVPFSRKKESVLVEEIFRSKAGPGKLGKA